MGSKTLTSLLVGCYSRAGTSDCRTLPSIFRVSRFRSFTTFLFYSIILKMSESRIRQNFHQDCEALINKQINMEFYASYVYLSMASYFNRDDQALTGFAAYFKKKSNEERDHGIKLSEYQANRGGRVVYQDIANPTPQSGEHPWMLSRLLLNLRRPSTKAFLIFTRFLMTREMLIFVTSLRPTTWLSRSRTSERWATWSPRSRGLGMASASTSWTRRWLKVLTSACSHSRLLASAFYQYYDEIIFVC